MLKKNADPHMGLMNLRAAPLRWIVSCWTVDGLQNQQTPNCQSYQEISIPGQANWPSRIKRLPTETNRKQTMIAATVPRTYLHGNLAVLYGSGIKGWNDGVSSTPGSRSYIVDTGRSHQCCNHSALIETGQPSINADTSTWIWENFYVFMSS